MSSLTANRDVKLIGISWPQLRLRPRDPAHPTPTPVTWPSWHVTSHSTIEKVRETWTKHLVCFNLVSERYIHCYIMNPETNKIHTLMYKFIMPFILTWYKPDLTVQVYNFLFLKLTEHITYISYINFIKGSHLFYVIVAKASELHEIHDYLQMIFIKQFVQSYAYMYNFHTVSEELFPHLHDLKSTQCIRVCSCNSAHSSIHAIVLGNAECIKGGVEQWHKVIIVSDSYSKGMCGKLHSINSTIVSGLKQRYCEIELLLRRNKFIQTKLLLLIVLMCAVLSTILLKVLEM